MKFDKKSLWKAWEKTLFYMASFHLLIIVYYAITNKEYIHLHMGDILDLKFLFPSLEYSTGLGILLVVVTLLFFLFNLKQVTKPSQKK